MIDFACTDIRVEDLMKCATKLTRAECTLFRHLMQENEWNTAEELSKQLDLDITTIQRGLKKLSSKGIIERRQNNLSGGGYHFLYRRESTEVVAQFLLSNLNSWSERAKKSIEEWSKGLKKE